MDKIVLADTSKLFAWSGAGAALATLVVLVTAGVLDGSPGSTVVASVRLSVFISSAFVWTSVSLATAIVAGIHVVRASTEQAPQDHVLATAAAAGALGHLVLSAVVIAILTLSLSILGDGSGITGPDGEPVWRSMLSGRRLLLHGVVAIPAALTSWGTALALGRGVR